MNLNGLGVDITDIKRFDLLAKNHKNRFLLNNFTKRELDYCFSFKNSGLHLAGTFCAKEAVFKAYKKKNILFSKFEIIRKSSGQPEVYLNGKHLKSILVSISYAKKIAISVAIKK